MQFSSSSFIIRQTFKKITILHKISCRRKKYMSSESLCKIDLNNLPNNAVLISDSHDIYENLAFEDWLYKNINFASHNIFLLLMWYNSPAVVIGRHQNPWTECSLDFCQASKISVARRNSGGGTVYHDYGNLNCSFMTPKQKYNRKNNLQIICDSMRRKWNLNLSITERDDILLDGKYKISGTASKIGRTNSYHHCTVLINVDEIKLKQALHRDLLCIKSRATSSIRSIVKNLKAVCPIDVTEGIEAIKEHYSLVYRVPEGNIFKIYPSEDVCPGISSILNHLKSWKWCFGHTPRFTIIKSFPLCPSFSKWEIKNIPSDLEICLSVNKGIIESILFNPQILISKNVDILNQYIIGMQFSPKIDVHLEKWVKLCNDEIFYKFVKTCILQMILDVHR